MFQKKRTHEQEEAHRHLVARAKEENNDKTASKSTTSEQGVTTTVPDGHGGALTVVIVVSQASPNASATGNSSLSLNSTSSFSTSTLPPPVTTSSSILPVNTTLPDTATNDTVDHHSLSQGAVAGISVGATIGALGLLAVIAYFYRRRGDNRRRSAMDMMAPNAPSSFPDPYQGFGGSHLPNSHYQGLDDEDEGHEGDMSQVGVSRRRSARSSGLPTSPY